MHVNYIQLSELISMIFHVRARIRALLDVSTLPHQDYNQDFYSDYSPINHFFELNGSLDYYDPNNYRG